MSSPMTKDEQQALRDTQAAHLPDAVLVMTRPQGVDGVGAPVTFPGGEVEIPCGFEDGGNAVVIGEMGRIDAYDATLRIRHIDAGFLKPTSRIQLTMRGGFRLNDPEVPDSGGDAPVFVIAGALQWGRTAVLVPLKMESPRR